MKNFTLMNQTAERMIHDIEAGCSTIGAVCAKWNRLCDENGFPNQKIKTPARRAALVENLRMMQTMINYGDERTDDEGNDPREWCGNDIEAAHAEALEANAGVDAAYRILTDKALTAYWLGCEAMSVAAAVAEWDRLHAEALEENSAPILSVHDELIAETPEALSPVITREGNNPPQVKKIPMPADLRGAGAPVCRAVTTQFVTFTHSGVEVRVEVVNGLVRVRFAGQNMLLASTRGGLRQKAIAELSKAGILPKWIK